MAEREKVQTKLDAAAALANLGQGAYDKAAKYFLKLGPIKGLEHWASTVSCIPRVLGFQGGCEDQKTNPRLSIVIDCLAIGHRHLHDSVHIGHIPPLSHQGAASRQ